MSTLPCGGLNNECRPAPSNEDTPFTLGGIVCSSNGNRRPHIFCKKSPGIWGLFATYI